MICGPTCKGRTREDFLAEDLTKTTRLLCDICKKLHNTHNQHLMPDNLKKWWINHQRADWLNKQAIQEQQTREQKKEALLKQLSREERDLLGIKE